MSDNLHLAWTQLLARALAQAGLRHVVISPGSRSTPLVLGLDAEPALTKHTVIDERAASFFALGLARAGQRVALLCTSGTAGAHYLPAVIEASQAHIPLLVLTADRPWEAYDCAASQTIDQVKLFGDHVRHHAELGLPDLAALTSVRRIAAQSALASVYPTPGPVHINARFRKPLEPVDAPTPAPYQAEVDRLLAAPPLALHPPALTPSPDGIAALVDLTRRHPRGLIVAGPAPVEQLRARPLLRQLSERLGYPLCAETTSQLRQGEPGALDVPSFDPLFRHRGFLERHRPELIVEIGLPPVAGAYATWLAGRPAVRRAVLAPHGWNDPHGDADLMLWSSAHAAAEALLAALDAPRRDDDWASSWTRAQRALDALAAPAAERLTEPAVARTLAARTPAGATVLVGNSGPVRDLDLYGNHLRPGVQVIHQRGAAGIDGWVAAAAGVASLGRGATVLYTGDVALLHDAGALSLAAAVSQPLVLVVVNNDGGRIFEKLPLARRSEVSGAFTRHFLTPHGRTFGPLASAWGLGYQRVTTEAALGQALDEALAQPRATLVEATVDAAAEARHREAMRGEIERTLAAL